MQIALWGLRGGVGTTTIAAMLAKQLSTTDQSVLVIDMNPADLLRLHFDVPYGDDRGWAGEEPTSAWEQQTHRVNPRLAILPYGHHRTLHACHRDVALKGDVFWAAKQGSLDGMFDWVVYDMPSGTDAYPLVRKSSDLNIVVSQADMASHILLEQTVLLPNSRILVNGLDPAYRLSNDILLAWRHRHGHRVLREVVRRDQNIHEAFAHKLPVADYSAGSAGARDMLDVARWCQAQRKRAA